MNLSEAQALALEVRHLYDKLNAKNSQKSWQASDYLSGMVGDVGDLQKLAMAKDGKRDFKETDVTLDQAIEHELSDIFWSVLVLAKEYNVDLEKGFANTMDNLKQKLDKKLGS